MSATAPAWPADQVERWPVEKLVPYARNARKHSPTQIAEIAGSIREWGWTIPALIDEEGQIIAGHGRVLAAHQLAIREIPVVIARGWSDAQKRAYTIADNEIAAHATWNKELLRVELADRLRNRRRVGETESRAESDARPSRWIQARIAVRRCRNATRRARR